MAPPLVEPLAEALKLSEQMSRFAEDAQWDQVRSLEEARRPLLQRCFPLRGDLPDPAATERQIRRILELDRRVMELAGAARGEVQEALRRMSQGRAAIQAYDRVGT